MKVLSVKQPWASLIFHGKNIENRTWHTKYRGEILIHASGNSSGIPSELLTNEQFDSLNLNLYSDLSLVELMAGRYIKSAIIGKATIIDCVKNHDSIWADQCHGVYNWVLENQVLFEKPILNVKGKLSFWDYE